MKVTLFTDPGCPFGFNAQRHELQLMWHYGHAIEIDSAREELEGAGATFTPSANDGYWEA